MLSPEQLQAYEDDGAVLVDLRLPPETLARLEAAWDGHSTRGWEGSSTRSHKASSGPDAAVPLWEDPDIVALFAHVNLERIAQQVLRSDAVHIFEIGRSNRPAKADEDGKPQVFSKHGHRTEWASGMHSDVQVISHGR